MEKRVRVQVEKLVDENEGAYSDVIVQFKSEKDKSLSELLKAAVDTERQRAMMVESRNALPPQKRSFEDSRPARQLLRGQGASLAANVALHSAKTIAAFAAGDIGDVMKAVTDLQTDPDIRAAIDAVKARLKSKADQAEPVSLPNIDGMRMMVKRGDLLRVVQKMDNRIEGVYANAHIEPPRVTPTKAITPDYVGAPVYDGVAWGVETTKALAAWSVYGTRGRRADGAPVRVAVLDTGIDAQHPDLAQKVVDFAEFNGAGGIAAQGLAHARDSGTHGTHVAGTIVGGNTSGGWIGVAPEAEVIAGLVLNGDAGGTLAQVIGGIDWAVGAGAHIINMSLSATTFDAAVGTPYQRAIVNALTRGTLVVAAIGNNGHQTSGAPGNDYFSLAVGAHDIELRCAGFSGGRTHVLNHSDYVPPEYLPIIYTKPDLSAPGVQVKSSVPNAGWDTYNGTSMASPHVAGAAALLYAATSLLDEPAQRRAFIAKDLLLGGSTDLGESGPDQRHGHGALNILKSIDEAIARGY